MATAVVTVAAGGLPVTDVTATAPTKGMAVTEAVTVGIAKWGTPVTKVSNGVPVTFVSATGGPEVTEVTDDFNRANGALGSNWANLLLAAYTGNPSIISNRVGMLSGGNHAVSYWAANTFAADQWCELSLPVAAQYAGPAVRCDPLSGSAYVCFIYQNGGGTDYWFFSYSGGAISALEGTHQLSATSITTSDVVRLEVTGSTLTIKLNGVTKGTYLVTVPNPAFGSPGFNVYDTTCRVDGFRAGPVVAAPAALLQGLFISDAAKVILPAGVLKIERTQPWSCLAYVTITRRDLISGSIVFTNVKDPPYAGYEIWIEQGGKTRVKIMHSNNTAELIQVTATTGPEVTDGTPHMIAATYDGSSLASGVKIYVDGVQQSTFTDADALSLTIVTGAGDMWIGNQYNGGQFGLEGVMHFFAFSNVVRDAAYMTAHATRATKPAVDANTTLYYDFTEGAGTSLNDQSANNYDATISGAGYAWV